MGDQPRRLGNSVRANAKQAQPTHTFTPQEVNRFRHLAPHLVWLQLDIALFSSGVPDRGLCSLSGEKHKTLNVESSWQRNSSAEPKWASSLSIGILLLQVNRCRRVGYRRAK